MDSDIAAFINGTSSFSPKATIDPDIAAFVRGSPAPVKAAPTTSFDFGAKPDLPAIRVQLAEAAQTGAVSPQDLAAFDAKYGGQQASSQPAPQGPPIGAGAGRGFGYAGQIPNTPNGYVPQRTTPDQPESVWDKIKGGIETAASTVAAVPATIAGNVAGVYHTLTSGKYGTQEGANEGEKVASNVAGKIQNWVTAGPLTQAGERYTGKVGEVANQVLAPLGPMTQVGELAQGAQQLKQVAGPTVGAALSDLKNSFTSEQAPPGGPPPEPIVKPRFKIIDGRMTRIDQPPIEAAVMTANDAPATGYKPPITEASAETQAAVAMAQKKGLPINETVLNRHIDAETLPVPMKLTAGQATMDPVTLSDEMNARGKQPELTAFYQDQGQKLVQNAHAIRDQVMPDVSATNVVQSGQTLVDAYKKMDAPIVADISAKYKALQDANGGHFPLDGKAFVDAADAALAKNLKSHYVPPEIRATMNDLREGGNMTFENFESMRSDLADTARSASDGKVRAAAAIIRDQLENMPLTPEAAQLKPLADAARSAAKARFDKIDADPAYKAVVGDKTPIGEASPVADNFVGNYVVRGKVANIQQMKANLSADPVANQAIAGAAVNHLIEKSGANPVTGNFSQAGWNKALKTDIDPKIDLLLDPKSAQHVQALGRVAQLTQAQPRGSYVNNSNTLVAGMKEVGKAGAEFKTNLAFGGLPVGTGIRKGMEALARRNALKNTLAPAAGVTKISDLPR
jgi:hypothetical protein